MFKAIEQTSIHTILTAAEVPCHLPHCFMSILHSLGHCICKFIMMYLLAAGCSYSSACVYICCSSTICSWWWCSSSNCWFCNHSLRNICIVTSQITLKSCYFCCFKVSCLKLNCVLYFTLYCVTGEK